MAQARAPEDDLNESVRAQQLLVATNVSSRYSRGAERLADHPGAGAEPPVGAGTDAPGAGPLPARRGSSLEVSDATNNLARAEGDYVNAVYEYHKAIAALEFAVGRPLR